MKPINRRESPRIEIKLRCYVASPANRVRSAMRTENMSRNGLLIGWTSEKGVVPPPGLGQIVTVEIVVPHVQDERSKEILRELAKLNPADPRETIWTKIGNA